MDVAIVVLAGGKSRRMGRDKLGLAFGGKTLLESVVGKYAAEFGEVYLSVASADKYPEIDAQRIVDIVPGLGPLSGLHAALSGIRADLAFLVAAHLPFASARAAKRIIELCGESAACVVRLPDGKLEPLFGCYRKTLLPQCSAAISSGDHRLTEILNGADTRFVAPNELGDLWSDKLIWNINYPEDYEKAALEFPRDEC